MIGVDYELFWTLNPKSLSPFIKAFSLRMKYDDKVAWQHGIYVKLAIASSFNKNSKYPTSPSMSSIPVVETEKDKQNKIKEKMFQQMSLLNLRFGTEVSNE